MTDLGTLGGAWSQGRAINNSGQVVGQSIDENGNARAFLYSNGGMLDLGMSFDTSDPGHQSYAFSINDSGQVAYQRTQES